MDANGRTEGKKERRKGGLKEGRKERRQERTNPCPHWMVPLSSLLRCELFSLALTIDCLHSFLRSFHTSNFFVPSFIFLPSFLPFYRLFALYSGYAGNVSFFFWGGGHCQYIYIYIYIYCIYIYLFIYMYI
jgi:hypothetical protein